MNRNQKRNYHREYFYQNKYDKIYQDFPEEKNEKAYKSNTVKINKIKYRTKFQRR